MRVNQIGFIALILFISFILTYLIRIISIRRGILDIPNARSSHSIPTPRGGGLAIVLSWYTGLSYLYHKDIIEVDLYLAFLPGLLLAIISLIDDIKRINPQIRLIVHFITVALSFYILNGIEPVELFNVIFLPKIILYPIVIIAMVWFINLYNFLDGIDGYASIEAICVLSGLFLITGDLINMIMIVSVLGFLIWNWPKAKIFMGDVGSTQLGFILFVLGIYYHNKSQFSIILWIILTSPFWFDATLTLFRRWRNKEKLREAHRKHIYQRLVQSGYSHLFVDTGLIIINMVIGLLIYFSMGSDLFQIIVLALSIIFLYIIALITDKRKAFPLD